jgi:SAM-dependent methyltransferase
MRWSLLERSAIYSWYSRVLGPDSRTRFLHDFVRPSPGCALLDLGCGPADVLSALPAGIDYLGCDLSPRYIAAARRRFGARGRFVCADVTTLSARELGQFDRVLASGLLHHLDDESVRAALTLARGALKPDGRLITLDGCFVPGQPLLERLLLHLDRGRFIREEPAYRALATAVFPRVELSIHHHLMRIPYTHVVMSCGL